MIDVRPDTPACVGTSGGAKRDSEGEWEVWPDEEFEEAARRERQADLEELEHPSQEQQDKPDNGSTQNHNLPFPGTDAPVIPNHNSKILLQQTGINPSHVTNVEVYQTCPRKLNLLRQISNHET